MGSALLHPTSRTEAFDGEGMEPAVSTDSLRHEIAERVAAHRGRRARMQLASQGSQQAGQQDAAGEPETQKARVAAAVAERYAKAQSYRAYLAAEAERAIQQARAAAEIARRNAEAVAQAQQRLIESLELEARQAASQAAQEAAAAVEEQMLWPELDEQPARPKPSAVAKSAARTKSAPPVVDEVAAGGAELAPRETPSGQGVRVVLYDENVVLTRNPAQAPPIQTRRGGHAVGFDEWSPFEVQALDEEISFRQAPVFEEPPGPPVALPANLIEFPRQLIASRKARPRYAEGPLRDEEAAPANGSQLRIFEVETAQISTTPHAAEPAVEPMAQWTSIWLDAPGARAASREAAHVEGVEEAAEPAYEPPARPHTAANSRRAIAAGIDLGIAGAGAVSFGLAFAAIAGHIARPDLGWSTGGLLTGTAEALQGMPVGQELMALAVAVGFLAVAYQMLFFTFSEATPGMRIARIGLCTFSDENPSRRAMRLRAFALLLSTVTLGMGFWWTLMDEDRLTWHDLISRMYQRSY